MPELHQAIVHNVYRLKIIKFTTTSDILQYDKYVLVLVDQYLYFKTLDKGFVLETQ